MKKVVGVISILIVVICIGTLLYFSNRFQNEANTMETNNMDTIGTNDISNKEENMQGNQNLNEQNAENSNQVDSNTEITENTVNSNNETVDNQTQKNNLVSYNGYLSIENNTLVNIKGEKIQLKGISSHGLQWFGNYANKDVIKTLRDKWGSNLFRIAMYTNEGGYLQDKSIKNKVEDIVNMAIDLDMYVIIDWHILSDGNPMDHLNESKIFFEEMSKKYANTPNVIYEICNEPNGNNITWEGNIKPYAEQVIDVIRKNSKDSIIIVGTGTWSQDVNKAANNPIKDKNVMYALHFYSGTHTQWLRDRAQEALKKIPIFVSEWGTSDASGNGGVYLKEAEKWVKFMKENNLSWANWSLCDKNESSALLIPNTPKNDISDKYLSESGKFVKKVMQDN